MAGYKREPVDEYEHILTNLQTVLSEVDDCFSTAELRMAITAKANNDGDAEKMVSEQINWGLDYLRRQELVDGIDTWEIGPSPSYNHEWLKNGYTDEKLEQVIDELE